MHSPTEDKFWRRAQHVNKVVYFLAAIVAFSSYQVHGEPTSEGPTPYPVRKQDWPGSGVIRTFGWMMDNRVSFWRERERVQNGIVFAGDSLTASWRSLPNDFPGERVVNRGIGGDVSRGLLFRFKEDVLSLNPKAIVILIGTNDLTARQAAAPALGNVRLMIDLVRTSQGDTPVLLCTVPPSANPEAPIDEEQRRRLNAGLREMAENDSSITLVDVFVATADEHGAPDPRYFRADLLHLSAVGHARWKALLTSGLLEAGVLSDS